MEGWCKVQSFCKNRSCVLRVTNLFLSMFFLFFFLHKRIFKSSVVQGCNQGLEFDLLSVTLVLLQFSSTA
jgi:hypothetical protein